MTSLPAIPKAYMRTLALLLLLPLVAQAQVHPWTQLAIDRASNGSARDSYVAWKATGEEAHLKRLIDGWLPATGTDRGWTGNYGALYSWLYAEIKPHCTPAQRAACEARIDGWVRTAFGYNPASLGSTRDADTDDIIGHYFLIRMAERATGKTYRNTVPAPGSMTFALMDTRVRQLALRAKGGEWFTGSMYELHDFQLLFMGAMLVGLDEFPEVKALAPLAGDNLRWKLTSDRKSMAQWGDMQPADIGVRQWNLVPALCLIDACGGGTKDLIAELTKDLPLRDLGEPIYILPFFDPATLPAPTASNPQGLRVCEGPGLVLYRQGDRLFQIHANTVPLWIEGFGREEWRHPKWQDFFFRDGKGAYYVDHGYGYLSDLRYWDGSKWLIDHPLLYQGADWNTALYCGWPGSHLHELVEATATPQGFTVTARVDGQEMHGPGVSNPPQWLREAKRTIAYDGAITVTDSIDCLARPDPANYWWRPAWQEQIRTNPLLQQRWHCQSEPQAIAGGWKWGDVTLLTDATEAKVEKLTGWNEGWWRLVLVSDRLDGRIVTRFPLGEQPPPIPDPPPDDPPPPDQTQLDRIEAKLDRLLNRKTLQVIEE